MKQRVHWLAATIIVVLSGTALSAWVWVRLELRAREYLLLLVLVCLPLVAVLGVHLASQQTVRVKSLHRAIRGTVKCTRWQWGTVISTILLILTTCIWARSLWFVDSLRVPLSPVKDFRASSYLGRCSIGTQIDSQRQRAEGIHVDSWTVGQYLGRIGQMQWILAQGSGGTTRQPDFDPHKWFAWNRGTFTVRGRTLGGTSVTFPHLIPLALFSIAPTVAIWRGCRRYSRDRSNKCSNCGYDLTGNVSGRCPECGREIERPPGSNASQKPPDS